MEIAHLVYLLSFAVVVAFLLIVDPFKGHID